VRPQARRKPSASGRVPSIEALLLTAARVCKFVQTRPLTNASAFFFAPQPQVSLLSCAVVSAFTATAASSAVTSTPHTPMRTASTRDSSSLGARSP